MICMFAPQDSYGFEEKSHEAAYEKVCFVDVA